MVDFSESMPIVCVKLFWERTNACEYAIEYSSDQKEWITAAAFEQSAENKEQTIFLEEPVQARYLRLHVWNVRKEEADLSLYYQNVFIGVAIILTGCMLYVADKMLPGKKTERTMTLSDALIIGLCQCVATIPGLSRSGTTITAGIATGLRREYAVKFSFLMSIPAVLGANILSFADAIKAGIDWAYVPAYLVGMVLALISGIASIHFIRYISAKAKFGGFAYYCWVVGVLAIVMSLIF